MLSGGPSIALMSATEKKRLVDVQRKNIRRISHLEGAYYNSGRHLIREKIQESLDNGRPGRNGGGRKRLIPKQLLIKKYGKEQLSRFRKYGRTQTPEQRIKLHNYTFYLGERGYKKPETWKAREGYVEALEGGPNANKAMALRHYFNTTYGDKIGKQKMIQHNIMNNKIKAEDRVTHAITEWQAKAKDPNHFLRVTQNAREAIHRYFQANGLPGGIREAKAVSDINKLPYVNPHDEWDWITSRYHGMMAENWQHRTNVEITRGAKRRYIPEPIQQHSLPSKIRLELMATKPLKDRVNTFHPSARGNLEALQAFYPGAFQAKLNRRTKKAVKRIVDSFPKSFETYAKINRPNLKKYVAGLSYSDIDNFIYGHRR
jgi:hypothetical protein